jgi:hypothetical protein
MMNSDNEHAEEQDEKPETEKEHAERMERQRKNDAMQRRRDGSKKWGSR